MVEGCARSTVGKISEAESGEAVREKTWRSELNWAWLRGDPPLRSFLCYSVLLYMRFNNSYFFFLSIVCFVFGFGSRHTMIYNLRSWMIWKNMTEAHEWANKNLRNLFTQIRVCIVRSLFLVLFLISSVENLSISLLCFVVSISILPLSLEEVFLLQLMQIANLATDGS